MAGILSALNRGNQKNDPMRESAALTTVYLLEQNQKFELFMRQKVDELESRVAAQQARLSTREEAEEREIWAALESFEEPGDEAMTDISLVDDRDIVSEAEFEATDSLFDGEEASPVPDAGQTIEPATEDDSEAIPDYLALMSGTADVMEANVPVEVSPVIPPIDAVEETAPVTATGDDEAIIVPEDGRDMADAEAWSPNLVTDDQASTELPPPKEATEFPSEEIESWSGQYEVFEVDFLNVEAVDDIGSELGLADEVELLAGQPTTNDKQPSSPNAETQVAPQPEDRAPGEIPETEAELEKANNEPSLLTTEHSLTSTGSEMAHQSNDETDEVWEAALSVGKKGDWS